MYAELPRQPARVAARLVANELRDVAERHALLDVLRKDVEPNLLLRRGVEVLDAQPWRPQEGEDFRFS